MVDDGGRHGERYDGEHVPGEAPFDGVAVAAA
jgi:hypothetical protein